MKTHEYQYQRLKVLGRTQMQENSFLNFYSWNCYRAKVP